ncbi:fucolectin-like [Magallana gigas]|uniref:fucolectin-like n=1 Tax=Magallana gigas TaxID=29159 RepID=UPI0033427F6A
MVHLLIGKYLNEVTFTTVLLCVVSLYEGVTSAVVPGERYRCPVVRVLEIIGQQQCVRECRHRPKLCRGVNYRKQELLCELVSAIDKTETNPDYVRIELNQTVNVPEMNQECLACSSDDQCVTLSSKKVHCIRTVSNLAFHKPATQSSTFTWPEAGLNYSANLAVDGNNGTDFVVDLCTSTAGGDTTPWWLVDLQAVYSIRSLRIFNRGMDEWGQDVSDRLRDVTVTVVLTESDVNTPCGFFAGPGTLSQLVVIDCPTLPQGRFVKISIITEYLTLCEVEVFGYSV